VCSSGKSCDAGSARHGAQLQACRAFLACKALSSIWSERLSHAPNMCTTNSCSSEKWRKNQHFLGRAPSAFCNATGTVGFQKKLQSQKKKALAL
jgi:hypothetical protein